MLTGRSWRAICGARVLRERRGSGSRCSEGGAKDQPQKGKEQRERTAPCACSAACSDCSRPPLYVRRAGLRRPRPAARSGRPSPGRTRRRPRPPDLQAGSYRLAEVRPEAASCGNGCRRRARCRRQQRRLGRATTPPASMRTPALLAEQAAAEGGAPGRLASRRTAAAGAGLWAAVLARPAGSGARGDGGGTTSRPCASTLAEAADAPGPARARSRRAQAGSVKSPNRSRRQSTGTAVDGSQEHRPCRLARPSSLFSSSARPVLPCPARRRALCCCSS